VALLTAHCSAAMMVLSPTFILWWLLAMQPLDLYYPNRLVASVISDSASSVWQDIVPY